MRIEEVNQIEFGIKDPLSAVKWDINKVFRRVVIESADFWAYPTIALMPFSNFRFGSIRQS